MQLVNNNNSNTFQAIVKSEPSYGEYTKKDLYTPYYPDPPHGRGMIGNTCLKKKNICSYMDFQTG